MDSLEHSVSQVAESNRSLVQVRIFRGQGVFETKAKVVYSHDAQLRSGMGFAFVEMAPDQRSLLEGWLAEIAITLMRLS